MNTEEILAKLETHDYANFQREALHAAILQQEAITPALLDIVGRVADNPQFLDDNPDYMGFTYALFLLAQFKENRAYPLIVQYFAQLGPEVEALDATGDIVTEDLHRILASVCQGDLSLIKQLIDDSKINEFVRGAAMESLVVLYNEGKLTYDELIDYFKALINEKLEQEEDESFWASLMFCCDKIYPGELYNLLMDCFERELVDTFMIGEEDIIDTMQRGKENVSAQLKKDKHYRFIDNAIKEMEWWACFHPNRPSIAPPKTTFPSVDYHKPKKEIKVGRNDPCICGSGKKYKKCCLK
jgi:hypothetical protein